MATATLLLPPCPRLLDPSSSSSSSYSHRFGPSRLGLGRARPWLELPSRAESSKRRRRRSGAFAIDPDHTSSAFLFFLLDAGYSPASYYTSLGLFVISVPGLWSLIKRSVKSKIVQKTFVREEGAAAPPNQVAGEILSFFTRNNFAVTDRGETITFEGVMVPSRGQAALLTFCTCISLGSVALVLSIAVPEGGNNWFWLMTLSPLAGVYYWTKASRKEEIKVKMVLGDNGSLSEIIVRGDDQQVEQMRKELRLSEKGMIYVKGIFER
ncbi:protein COFACTOR ASSEMBLY OF COMPLEX C SUBUNIT B CCB1, chloroplastic-like [Ananas comosus]|uniref:Protein COFACTOR ASSEMBLY OF COMPLEX C SUBUNIT B CCB1, chloroplastic-like n=1 Tax=Ananas comosus TaxID=4615 RepID=A0A6P5GFC4_ANACO|nr:protein COFACTOR ASSEMBLY OF COMPLEX C SUBUNIT B CCB1, chloroplastic-like [Ananas comosus]